MIEAQIVLTVDNSTLIKLFILAASIIVLWFVILSLAK
jgi:hypothetical protein